MEIIRPVVNGRADAVQAVVFLLSDESTYITGSEMVVDGSLTIGVPHKSEVPDTIF
nr:SDR family oxidoreductase [Bradyrhizobium sp. USDA 4541]